MEHVVHFSTPDETAQNLMAVSRHLTSFLHEVRSQGVPAQVQFGDVLFDALTPEVVENALMQHRSGSLLLPKGMKNADGYAAAFGQQFEQVLRMTHLKSQEQN